MSKQERESQKLTRWKKEPSYEDLVNDLKQSNEMQETIRANLKRWELYREGGSVISARPGKSTVRPKLIRKHNEWRYPAMEEPFLNTEDMFEIMARTAEDAEAAEQNALLLNFQWSTKINKTALVNSIVRTYVDEGTVIVKSGWESEEGIKVVEEEQPVYADPEESMMMIQQAVANGEMAPEEAEAMMQTGQPMQIGTEKVYVERVTLVKNQPTYEVCNNANVIVDPTCEGIIENAQFVIHEYATSMSELNKQKYQEIIEIEIGEDGIEKEVKTETGIYKNLDMLKEENDEWTYDEYDSASANSFKYQDKARKKLRAFEYWGFWDIHGDGEVVSIVATWIGKTLVRMEENPFPHGDLPFSIATYMPVKKETFGEPDAEVLIENQDSIGKMMRAAHDITSAHAVGQTFIDEQMFPSPVQRENYRKGNTVFFRSGINPRDAIYTAKTEDVPNTVFNIIEMQSADADSMSGATGAGAGGGQALGTSATGIRSALDARSKRELSILRRLSDMLFKDMARKTIANNQAYLDEKEIIRITNKFVTIRRDDLAGEFDLKIDVSTPEKDAETAEKLANLLQTNAASMDQEEARIIRTKMAKLWKIPDLAEQIANFEPTPDPVATKLQEMEIEKLAIEIELNKKLVQESDSRIHERISRVIENEKDVENKQSQNLLRQQQVAESAARTAKIIEETDSLKADFVDRETGAKRAREIEDKEFDLQADLTKEELKAQIAMLQKKLDGKSNKETTNE